MYSHSLLIEKHHMFLKAGAKVYRFKEMCKNNDSSEFTKNLPQKEISYNQMAIRLRKKQ
jgi:hypothetical protein